MQTPAVPVLNCLVEEGGKLVVGERGMLEAQVVIMPRQENLSVLLYDPSRV